MLQDLKSSTEKQNIKTIKVAILAEEPLGWGSGKHYFPIILNNYSWVKDNLQYRFLTENIFDKDIIKGKLNLSNFDVLLVPGGGVGDGEAITKGFNLWYKVKKWKKNISKFIEDGGGYVGICGGTALFTNLITESGKGPTTFAERQYKKSCLGISCVSSYYKELAFPIFYPFQIKNPEKIGAMGYIFSFAPGETVDGIRIHTGGVPIDFNICKDNPIFNDFKYEKLRIRWWGGPGLVIPDNPDRNIKVLARYPKNDLSADEKTNIHAWKYMGGVRGIFAAMIKSLKLIKSTNNNLSNFLLYTYYLAGEWKRTDRIIQLNHQNKACMTAEIFPNKNEGRILLCAAHPEYMIWWNGCIDEVEQKNDNCLAYGLHQWKDISSLSKTIENELTHTWWVVRRSVAWAAKIQNNHLPPIEIGKIDEDIKSKLSENIYWDGTLINNMKNI